MKINLTKLTQVSFIIFFCLLLLAQFRCFYNSISTLILLIGILLLSIFYFCSDQSSNRKKHLLYLLVYGGIILLFFIMSYFHHQSFSSLVPGNFNYNILSELLYFIKMSMPFLMLFVFSKLDIDTIFYSRVIKWTTIIISIVIIVSNITLISYGSYSDEIIRGNFFTWFTNGYDKYTFYHLASKGFFYSANQISAILLLFLPINFYNLIKKPDWRIFLINFLQIFAMLLLGTKVSVMGSILIMFVMIVMGLFYTFLKKEISFQKKNIIYVNMLLLFWICIFPFAPVHNRINVQNKINEEDKLAYCFVDSKRVLESPTNRNVALLSKEEKLKYIEKNYKSKRIYKHFILESYPYNYDPDFWYSILELPVSLRTDYRFLEEEMIKRIIEVNNNSYDKLFGISYTRLQNIFNIERDFIVQYYSVGIIGSILFLGIYFVMVVNILYFIFKKKLNNCFFALSLLCGSCVLLVVSYYSGNLLNSLMVTPYLCLSLGYAKKEVIEKE